ncbi:MAG: MFS transporter [Gammaproteobacteria bacterium]|nr:MFS transporter [Gammaproteobacteria bacterium]
MIVDKKKYYSWVLYDWANSAYATIVLAGFFPIIFSNYYADILPSGMRTLLLGISNSSASLLLIILAPFLGLISDRYGDKKKFLLFFASVSITSTLLLVVVDRDSWAIASILFSISVLGFMLSNVFYDSMIMNFNEKKFRNTISSYGYAFGYLGGGIAFIIAILVVLFSGSNIEIIQNKKISFLIASLWWLLFMIPLILYWKEPNQLSNVKKVFLKDTFIEIFNNKHIFYFLLAYWTYIDGVDTIIRMAVNYGITLGFNQYDLLLALLIVQFVSFPGTLFINFLANRTSTETGIIFCILLYMVITLFATVIDSLVGFYSIAVSIGIVQGGIQALSRSYFANIIPQSRDSEFFGIYNMLGKFAALIGPLLVGLITYLTDSSRLGISSIILLFIIGLFLMIKVKQINT